MLAFLSPPAEARAAPEEAPPAEMPALRVAAAPAARAYADGDCGCWSLVARLLIWATRNNPPAR